MEINDPAGRTFLRHTLATVAYRAGKALRDAPPGFGEFRAFPTSRTPGEILAHMCDLYGWMLTMCDGSNAWVTSTPGEWDADVERFFDALRRMDEFLAGDGALPIAPERLFQGPVADSLTHAGQIAMLRRMADGAIKGENYVRAEIAVGNISADQPPSVYEFD